MATLYGGKRMKQEKVLKELGSFLVKTLKETKSFVVEQAPDVVQQIIKFNTALAWFGIFGFSLLLGLMVTTWTYFYPFGCAGTDLQFIVGASAVFGGVSLIFCVGMLVQNMIELLKLKTAPKLYLIEYLRRWM
jgi:hypothetical protein